MMRVCWWDRVGFTCGSGADDEPIAAILARLTAQFILAAIGYAE